MLTELRAAWALLIGIGFMMLGNGLQGTLLGSRAIDEGFPTFLTGIMMSGYFVGIFFGSMLAPRLVQRVGHIRVFAALASLASISILVHGIYINVVTWTLMRLVTGMCYAGLFVVTESWLNDRASNETRGQVLSFYMVITMSGLGGGQFLMLVGGGDQPSVNLFVLVSIIVSVGLIPILLTARPAPAFAAITKMPLIELYRASPLAVISNGLTGVAHGTIFGLGAVYATQVLQNIKQVSLFMACLVFGGLIFQWPVGWLADHINRRVIMVGMCVLAMFTCILPIFLPQGSVAYFISIALLGGAAMPMYPLCVAYANDRLEPEQIVAASGSLVMIAGVGLSLGPIIVSFFMAQWGVHWFFFGIAAAFTAMLGFVGYRMNITEAIAPEAQSPVVAAGAIGTPVAEYVAPDAEEYVEAMISDELHLLDQSQEAAAEEAGNESEPEDGAEAVDGVDTKDVTVRRV